MKLKRMGLVVALVGLSVRCGIIYFERMMRRIILRAISFC